MCMAQELRQGLYQVFTQSSPAVVPQTISSFCIVLKWVVASKPQDCSDLAVLWTGTCSSQNSSVSAAERFMHQDCLQSR